MGATIIIAILSLIGYFIITKEDPPSVAACKEGVGIFNDNGNLTSRYGDIPYFNRGLKTRELSPGRFKCGCVTDEGYLCTLDLTWVSGSSKETSGYSIQNVDCRSASL